MNKIISAFHLRGIWKKIVLFLINHIITGMSSRSFHIKRSLLNSCGNCIGEHTAIVSPINIKGKLITGSNCWINCGFTVHGNGTVIIGDSCDIGPDVCFLTGGHQIGNYQRRAGKGETYSIYVGNGCWIGARSTILGNTHISDSSVIAACACVIKDIPSKELWGGVPARYIRRLD